MTISCITVYGAMPSGTFSLNFRKDDPTLGGIFELYSVEECSCTVKKQETENKR